MAFQVDNYSRLRTLIEQDGAYLLENGRVGLDKLDGSNGDEGQVVTRVEGRLVLADVPTGGGGSSTPSVVTCNTNTTIATTDNIVLVTGGVTITLPASPTTGLIHEIKDAAGTAGTSNITVSGNGHNIDGAATQIITSNWEAMRVVYSGTAWYRI